MKDMFRSRVVAAQATVRRPAVGHAELNSLEKRVLKSKWWEAHKAQHQWGDPRLHQDCADYDSGSCYFYRPAELALMHALAHHMVPYEDDTPFHGPEFAKAYLTIVKRWLGAETKASLALAFVEHKVKFRTWSGAAKEKAKQRYTKKDLASLLDELQ